MRILPAALACLLLPVNRLPAADPVDYLRDVKPLLTARCVACHGSLKQRAGLRLDTAALIRKGGKRGLAIVPGKAADSRLLERVTATDQTERMPPEGAPLTAAQVAVLRAWIDQGAKAPADEVAEDPRNHWSLKPPSRPPVPAVRNQGWLRNPIDAFVAARHEARGLVPRHEADRAVLLRRVYLDLVGLPPTREKLHAFLADPSADAYEKVVERLLASPQYGERWARHWMDVWRYSDRYGGPEGDVRHSQRHIWRWRDWIVEALNGDKGYDRMIIEMLAGDEIAPGDPDTLRATGYVARNWYVFDRNKWITDTVDYTFKAFLATTLSCARCHDHKYDPIAQTDYYRVRACFEPVDVRTDRVRGQYDILKEGVARVYDGRLQAQTFLFRRGNEQDPEKTPLVPGIPAALSGRLRIEPVRLPLLAQSPDKRPGIADDQLADSEAGLPAVRNARPPAIRKAAAAVILALSDPRPLGLASGVAAAQLSTYIFGFSPLDAGLVADLEVPLAETRHAALVEAVRAEKLEDAGRHGSAEWTKAATKAATLQREAAALEAKRNVIGFWRNLGFATEGDRLYHAKNLADGEKELVRALAELKKPPTTAYTKRPMAIYPDTSTGRRRALAGWIAARSNPLTARVAVNHIWLRHFGQALVPSLFDFGRNGQRPTHPELLDWLAVEFMDSGWNMKHLHRLIVTSATYRLTSSAGPANNVNRRTDPENRLLWRMNVRRMEAEVVRDSVLFAAGQLELRQGGPDLDHEQGLTTHRRSLYYHHGPVKRMPFLDLFDVADANECYRRQESIVPHQALALVNSGLVLEQSRRLARILSLQGRTKDDAAATTAFVNAAFEQVLGRPASAAELRECQTFLGELTRELARGSLTPLPGEQLPSLLPARAAHLRARENLILVLFNHNDFVSIR